ncbi:MAG TPA: hypothetical protein PK691_12475, partial [Thermomicrobiales bacterium]|nr:hypothetical protein [Thermomicrobiales bacterium]
MTKWHSGQAIRAAALTLKRQESTNAVLNPPAPFSAASVDPSPIRVRRLQVRDLRLLGHRIDVQYLDQPTSRIDSGGLFTTGLGSIRPFARQRPLTHIALTTTGDFAGVIQFRQSVPDPRWTALAIGTVDAAGDPDRIAEALIEFSIKRAGSRGIRRLFARLPVESMASAHFQRCGFEPYMRESIVQVNPMRTPSVVSRYVREQDQTDTWAVHQLYHAAAPRHVQFAEAWTSQRWDPATFKSQAGQSRAWLIEGNGQVVAYVH